MLSHLKKCWKKCPKKARQGCTRLNSTTIFWYSSTHVIGSTEGCSPIKKTGRLSGGKWSTPPTLPSPLVILPFFGLHNWGQLFFLCGEHPLVHLSIQSGGCCEQKKMVHRQNKKIVFVQAVPGNLWWPSQMCPLLAGAATLPHHQQLFACKKKQN